MKNSNIRFICEIAILAAMIGITGAIKLPNVIPGIEIPAIRATRRCHLLCIRL